MIQRQPEEPVVLAAVVNFERADLTAQTVTDLLAQTHCAITRIVVIDSGSSPADRARLGRAVDAATTIVALEHNAGYGPACNAAVEIAARDGLTYAWLMNNDIRLPADTLALLLEALEADPRAAAASAVTVASPNDGRVLCGGVTVDVRRGLVRHRFAGASLEALPHDPFPAEALEASCMLVRVAAFRHSGGFDPGYFMYWEDTDWSVRSRRLGYSLLVVPRACVRHLVAASSPEATRIELILRNRIRFVRAIGSPWDQVVFAPYFLLLWLPAYTVGRLVPRFGIGRGLRIAWSSVAWNVGDAARRRRWRLGRASG